MQLDKQTAFFDDNIDINISSGLKDAQPRVSIFVHYSQRMRIEGHRKKRMMGHRNNLTPRYVRSSHPCLTIVMIVENILIALPLAILLGLGCPKEKEIGRKQSRRLPPCARGAHASSSPCAFCTHSFLLSELLWPKSATKVLLIPANLPPHLYPPPVTLLFTLIVVFDLLSRHLFFSHLPTSSCCRRNSPHIPVPDKKRITPLTH